MEEQLGGDIWALLPKTEPIPLWDVENGRFIAEMDYNELDQNIEIEKTLLMRFVDRMFRREQ